MLMCLAMSLCSSDGCPTGHLLQKGTGHHQKVSTARPAGRGNDECSATQDEIISQHTYTHKLTVNADMNIHTHGTHVCS